MAAPRLNKLLIYTPVFLDAAEDLFLTDGFSATGIETIAKQANTSKATVCMHVLIAKRRCLLPSNRVLNTHFSPIILAAGSLQERLTDLALQMLDALLM